MVTEATKKYREIFAFGLLGVAALYLIGGLSLLFKSSDDLGGAGFSERAAWFGYVFTHPLLVVALFGAVAFVTGFGENSKNAKAVVLTALGLGVVALVFGIICWFASFGADTGPSGSFADFFNGVFGAGKIVGIFLGLAQLLLLALVTFYAWAAYQALPKAVRAQQSQWSQQQGWGQQQAGWGQQGYEQGQQGWGQQAGYSAGQGWAQQTGHDQGQQAWGAAGAWGEQSQAQAEQQGQPAASWEQMPGQPPAQQGWGQPEQAWQQPEQQQQQSWGQPEQQSWPQPEQQQQQSWGQPEQQQQQPWGQPEQAWQQPEQQQSWSQPDSAQQSWGSPTAEPEQSPYAPPGDSEGSTPGGDETQVWTGPAEDQPGQSQSAPEEERADEDKPPPPQQGWWQQPSQ